MSDLERVVVLTGNVVHWRRPGEGNPLCHLAQHVIPVAQTYDPSYYDDFEICRRCRAARLRPGPRVA